VADGLVVAVGEGVGVALVLGDADGDAAAKVSGIARS
jgi:hypothetical protein